MIKFDGLVMNVAVSKDGTKQYAEVADRESFTRYQVSVPAGSPISQGDVVTLDILGIRAFNGRITMEGKVSADRKSSDLRGSESK